MTKPLEPKERITRARDRGRKLVANARARAERLLAQARTRSEKMLLQAIKRGEKLVDSAQVSAHKLLMAARAANAKSKRKPSRGATMVRSRRPDQVSQFLDAVRTVTAKEKPGALLSVNVVRTVAQLPKTEFDRIALDLSAKRRLVLHHHDFPQALSAAQLERLIKGPNGVYYIGLALPTARTKP